MLFLAIGETMKLYVINVTIFLLPSFSFLLKGKNIGFFGCINIGSSKHLVDCWAGERTLYNRIL